MLKKSLIALMQQPVGPGSEAPRAVGFKKPFFGFQQPRLVYGSDVHRIGGSKVIGMPKTVVLLLDEELKPGARPLLKAGNGVHTGQRLKLYEESPRYVVSTVTGTISAVSAFAGNFGQMLTAIHIQADAQEVLDEAWAGLSESRDLDRLADFLAGAPGMPPVRELRDRKGEIDTIVIAGVDKDLWVDSVQFALKTRAASIKEGVRLLKAVTGIEKIYIAAPDHLMHDANATGAKPLLISAEYPGRLPQVILRDHLGKTVPAGGEPADVGVAYFSAEAVAAIGDAFAAGRPPLTKLVTLIRKDGSKIMVSARIGTPIARIFKDTGVEVAERDRIVFGGPMTGFAVFSEDHPVQADTDAIIVQDRESLSTYSDYPCVNCGDCIRVCPAAVPVNMLVRFLEAGQYETAADEYDLFSCVECGLCSFVCITRIPVLQYIKLAKYELARAKQAEEVDE